MKQREGKRREQRVGKGEGGVERNKKEKKRGPERMRREGYVLLAVQYIIGTYIIT